MIKPKTKVTVDFTISLDELRYQDDRVVPDENRKEDETRSRLNRSSEFPGVVPDYDVVIELTNAISRDEYYVKSVVEHVPFRDDNRANVLNRVWDLAGRFYTGVFPIDFDIRLGGEEAQGATGALAGKTAVQVVVKGAYATGGNADGRLLEKIEDRWDDLHGRVVQVLSDRSAANGAQSSAGAPYTLDPMAAPPVESATGQAAIGQGAIIEPLAIGSAQDTEPTAELVPAPAGEVAAAAAQPVNGIAEQKADLRRQWKIADEAVMTGRISEDVYKAIVTRITAELEDLGEYQ